MVGEGVPERRELGGGRDDGQASPLGWDELTEEARAWQVLESEPDIQVVGEARDGAEAIERALMLRPDVVLMDIGMPGLSSFEASRRITRELPGRRVIFLTMYEDEEYLLQCLDAGASGYILKDAPSPRLIGAVRDVNAGRKYLSPQVLGKLVDNGELAAGAIANDEAARDGVVGNPGGR